MSPTVFAIVGHSGAGKTTLIERLLPILCAKGLRVATIKHSHHAPALDVAGTDSYRHKYAGATASMLVTQAGLKLITDSQPEYGPCELAKRYFSDMDMVLVEGYSQAACRKIEVLRSACDAVPRCLHEHGLIALVTDVDTAPPSIKRYGLDDSQGVADFIFEMHQHAGRPA